MQPGLQVAGGGGAWPLRAAVPGLPEDGDPHGQCCPHRAPIWGAGPGFWQAPVVQAGLDHRWVRSQQLRVEQMGFRGD